MNSDNVNNVVETKHGKVQGLTKITDDGKSYSTFFGIPYAKQPVGELRFRDPEPIEAKWKDIFDATQETTGAHQLAIFDFTDEEDNGVPRVLGSDNCLILNVFSPNLHGKLPVYVWIHGGGFICGSSSTDLFGPDYLIDEDIVVVTINYRLGVVGFLSFRDESLGIPGNAGLKDQNMALKWVKENISDFGGDPNNITLAGESAGGGSVHFHLISPMSEGLFNRAIVQSGSVFNPWACISHRDVHNYEYELAKVLGWDGEGGDRGAYGVIAATPIEQLVQFGAGFIQDIERKVYGSGPITAFIPKIEPYEGRLCFLSKPLMQMGRNPWSKNMDIMIGGTKDEGYIFEMFMAACVPVIEKKFKLLIPKHSRYFLTEEEQKNAAETLKKLYFGEDKIDMLKDGKFYETHADYFFWFGIYRHLLQRYNHWGSGKTFLYLYGPTADPDLKSYKILRKANKVPHLNGTGHADDLLAIFKTKFSSKPTEKNKIYPSFVKFFSAYASFIKTGNPNNAKLGQLWKTIGEKETEDEGFACMNFEDDGKVNLSGFSLEPKLKVWNNLCKEKIFGQTWK